MLEELKLKEITSNQGKGIFFDLGTIWILTPRESNLTATILLIEEQFIHMIVEDECHKKFFITATYASTNYITRRRLWGSLRTIANYTLDSWVVVDDFNSITTPEEKRGRFIAGHAMKDFNKTIEETGLVNIGFQGNTFT